MLNEARIARGDKFSISLALQPLETHLAAQARAHARPTFIQSELNIDHSNLEIELPNRSDCLCAAGRQIAWLKEETKTILSIDTNIIITNYRIFLIPDEEERKWVLHIKDVQESDRVSH